MLASENGLLGGVVETGLLPDRWELVTFQDKHSMLAESFRATLTSILFCGQNGTRPRMLVFTSGHPAEFAVHKWRQLVESALVASPPGLQEYRHLAWLRGSHTSIAPSMNLTPRNRDVLQ